MKTEAPHISKLCVVCNSPCTGSLNIGNRYFDATAFVCVGLCERMVSEDIEKCEDQRDALDCLYNWVDGAKGNPS